MAAVPMPKKVWHDAPGASTVLPGMQFPADPCQDHMPLGPLTVVCAVTSTDDAVLFLICGQSPESEATPTTPQFVDMGTNTTDGATPVPDSAATCVPAPVTIVSVPVYALAAGGVNVVLTVHEP